MRCHTSGPQPAAWTWMSSSSSPTEGSATSRSSSTSGPPNLSCTIAFIASLHVGIRRTPSTRAYVYAVHLSSGAGPRAVWRSSSIGRSGVRRNGSNRCTSSVREYARGKERQHPAHRVDRPRTKSLHERADQQEPEHVRQHAGHGVRSEDTTPDVVRRAPLDQPVAGDGADRVHGSRAGTHDQDKREPGRGSDDRPTHSHPNQPKDDPPPLGAFLNAPPEQTTERRTRPEEGVQEAVPKRAYTEDRRQRRVRDERDIHS